MSHVPEDRTVHNTPVEHVADHNELARLHNLLDAGLFSNWYSSVEVDGDVVAVEFVTPFGIDANTGIPYFDPGNVTEGEEAVLLEDLSLVQPGK